MKQKDLKSKPSASTIARKKRAKSLKCFRAAALVLALISVLSACNPKKVSPVQSEKSSVAAERGDASLSGRETTSDNDGRPLIRWGVAYTSFMNHNDSDQMIQEKKSELCEKLSSIVDNYISEANLPYKVETVLYDRSPVFSNELPDHVYEHKNFEADELLQAYPKLDVFQCIAKPRIGKTPYEKAAEAGLISDLDPYMDSEAGKMIKENIGYACVKFSEINHKLYGINGCNHFRVPGIAYSKKAVKELGLSESELPDNVFDAASYFEAAAEKGYQPFQLSAQAYGIYDSGEAYISFPNCPNLILTEEGFSSYFDRPESERYLKLLSEELKNGYVSSPGFIRNGQKKDVFCADGTSQETERFEASVPAKGLTAGSESAVGVPNTKQMRIVCDDTYAWSVRADSEYPAESFDWISRILCDRKLNAAFEKTNFQADYSLSIAMPPIESYASEKKLNELADEIFKDLPFRGFRFDTEPVQDEVKRCNALIGTLAEFDETKLRQEVQDLYYLKAPMDETIEKVRVLLKESGMDKIVSEAARQYEKWKKEGPEETKMEE